MEYTYVELVEYYSNGMDLLYILGDKYRMVNDLLLDKLHFGHMCQDMDLYICFDYMRD